MPSATDFDPLGAEVLDDPYPVFAELQATHPVFWHEKMSAWVVTRYDDCRDILMDADLFVRDARRVSEVSSGSGESIGSIGADQQTELRRLVVGSMHAQDLGQLGRNIRASIDRILGGVASRPSFDWMTEVAAPVAGTITAELLGIAEPDPRIFAAIVQGMARNFDADVSGEDPEAAQRVKEAFGFLIEGWLNAEDTHGTVRTIKEQAAEMGMPMPVVKNSVGLLFIGAFGTIFGASGNVATMVMERPDVLERLRDPGLQDTGIDELLRFDGPTLATSRIAMRDTEVRGVTIKQGDPFFVVMAAANRDPAQFPQPQELVLDRTPNKHFAFGWGPHSCLGQLFGQLALRELVRALHNAPALRPAGTAVRIPAITVRSFASLPVSFQS
jgi:cytochrome P450